MRDGVESSGTRRFGPKWSEDVTLADGATIRLRMIRPEDKHLLVQGFERLSPESRYMRFLSAKDTLSASELRYLTEVDGEDHVAIAASRFHPDGREEGLGVARFVRLTGDPTAAEAAVVVLDDAQGRGLGGVLLARLAEAARERGVTHFRAMALSSNARIRSLLESLAVDRVDIEDEGQAVVLDVPIVAPSTAGGDAPPAPLQRLLSAAAEGAVDVFQLLERWLPGRSGRREAGADDEAR